MLVKQISVFVQNEKGRLSKITDIMAKNGIDIRSITISDTVDYGILRLIVNDPEKCKAVLTEAGFTVSITNVLAIGIDDIPGSLAKVFALCDEKGINVEYVYAFISHTTQDACIIMRVLDGESSAKILKDCGVKILSEEEVYQF
ncbi:MAG: ACT domain-containing protein [Oscillospiraceae bacterium]|nr:ACT domain-containing protein [Oscillospiraceae bacterium]